MDILFTFSSIIFTIALVITLISAREKQFIFKEEKLPLIGII
jgi:hypothetical protein